MAKQLLLQLLPVLLLFTTICVSAGYPGTMRLGVARRSMMSQSYMELPPEFVAYNYTQTLDHFNYKPESYATFQQKYIINSKYWGGANTSSPIFFYAGAETDITEQAAAVGFIVDLAVHFNGLLLYIEHRYYGDSMPFGYETYQNASNLGYFSSSQALADYAQLITDLKKNLSAENCPIIAVGGSYGGMLASWFRLKYPHIVIGALASSAPILYFDDITPQNGYSVVVTKDFQNTSESCYNTIRQSWSEIDRVAAQANGLVNLSNIFTNCGPFTSSQDLKDLLTIMYKYSAQYDNPPYNYVSNVCGAIDGAPEGTYILGRIAAGLNASIFGQSCHNVQEPYVSQSSNEIGWTWQACTEMVIPIGNGDNDTMFQAAPFDLNNFAKACVDYFGVGPRPHWITTEFGGHDIKSVLGNFASNIIFSNGLRDPYSAGGVLQDISDTVVAVHTDEGAHCLDLVTSLPSDPDWLIAQRDKEIKIIELWIAEYNATLASNAGNRIG